MVVIAETRLANLEELAAQYPRLKDFADAAGVSPSYYSQLRSGTKVLGSELARRIELRMGLQPGTLDTPPQRTARLPSQGSVRADTAVAAAIIDALPSATRDGVIRMLLQMQSDFLAMSSGAQELAPNFSFTIPPGGAPHAGQQRGPIAAAEDDDRRVARTR